MGDSSDSDSTCSAYSITTESEFSLTGDWSDHSEDESEKKSKHMITPGVSKLIFEAIKKKVPQIQAKDRICALLMHEVDIEPHMNYLPREDYIIGFQDFGWERFRHVADNAVVFMLRSIYGSWKQPVAFAFCDYPLKKDVIIRFLKEIVNETKAAGLNLVAFVCTHADYNMDALDVLRKETKESVKVVNDNVLVIGGQEIVAIFDPSILLVSIRNNLLDRALSFVKDGESKVAKWEHIMQAYEIDRELSEHLSKITEKHVIPDKINKANITTSVQVFSSTVAGFLKTIAGKTNTKASKTLPIEATETAELIYFFDQVFDSVNGSSAEADSDKKLRRLVTDTSPHSKVWVESKQMFANMEFLGHHPEYQTRVLHAWPRTLDAFELIRKKLADLGHSTFPARSFNLDPLENCFDLMRAWAKKKRNQNLTCMRFSVFYNMALESKDVSGCHAEESNCEADGLSFLVSTKGLSPKKEDGSEVVL